MADQNPFNEQPNPFDNQEPNPFADTGAPDAGSAGGPSLSGTGTGDAFNPFYEGRQANPFSSQDSGSPYDGATTQAILDDDERIALAVSVSRGETPRLHH
mmetsp:Transcript_23343/g.28221  ORF Transcript_23343/g.28221 Transcript_23343/m.28221 type:complete len:100 (+) Transcript_23343:214-513(+)